MTRIYHIDDFKENEFYMIYHPVTHIKICYECVEISETESNLSLKSLNTNKLYKIYGNTINGHKGREFYHISKETHPEYFL